MKNNILIWGMMTFFVVLGVIMPHIADEFGFSQADNDVEGFQEEILQDDVTATDVILSMITVWFWSFEVPNWLNLILLLPLRILFWIIVYDKFRGVSS